MFSQLNDSLPSSCLGPQLLKETGFDAVQATALTAAVSVAQLLAVAVLMKFVDTGKF